MRLKNMYYLCRKHRDALNSLQLLEDKNVAGRTTYVSKTAREFINALTSLCSINLLEETCSTLLNYCYTENELHVPSNKNNQFSIALKTLQQKVEMLIELGDSIGFSDYEFGFDIKIPPNLTFQELGSCISEVSKAFDQCPYLHTDGEKIQFEAADLGSFWLSFVAICTGTHVLLDNLAKLVDKAIKIISHTFLIKAQKEQLRQLEIDTKLIETMTNGYIQIHDALISKCIDELGDEISPLESEDKERVRFTLDLLTKWMERGLEIHASINSPQEVKDIFPVSEQQSLLKPVELFREKAESKEEPEA